MINIVLFGLYQLIFALVKIFILTEYQLIDNFFKELNIQDFDFTKGFKCSDAHKFEKLNNSPINIFEINFYQDQDQKNGNII